MKIILLLAAFSVCAASAVSGPLRWDESQAKENARATVRLIRNAQVAIAAGRPDVEKTDLPKIERMIAGFKDQLTFPDAAANYYGSCLDALESFRPYLLVSVRPASHGNQLSMASSKKVYTEDIASCKRAAFES